MTDRPTASTITDTQLDALHERLAKAEQEADAAVAAAAHLTTLVGKRSEKAERTAKEQQRRADIAETELHVLRSGLRANGADPTQIQNLWAQIRLRNRQWREEKQRAERAEAAIARVRALAERWETALPGQPHHGFAEVLRAALGEPAPGPATTQTTERSCLFARDGARPCPASDRCATCDPKEKPGA
jgi:multidrug efflux pump subunit AcrA (membrane-fusion protein)